MSAGRRRIVAEAPGRPALLRVVDVAGGDLVQLKIELPQARAPQGLGEGAGGAPARRRRRARCGRRRQARW